MLARRSSVIDWPVPGWFVAKFVFSVLISIHLCKVAKFIPVPSLPLDVPIVENGHSQMYADVLRDRELADTGGQGYDPYQLAGYPAGQTWEFDYQVAIAVDRVLRPWFSAAKSMRLAVFVALLLLPFLVYSASLCFSPDKKIASLAMALNVAGFANFDAQSQEMVRAGWSFYLLGNCWALFCVGRFFRLVSKPSAFRAFKFAVAFALLLAIHPISFLLALVPIILIYTMNSSRLVTRVHRWIIAGVLIAVAVNYPWLYRFLHISISAPLGFLRQHFPAFFGSPAWDDTLWRLFIIFSGGLGLQMLRKHQPVLARTFLISLVGLGILLIFRELVIEAFQTLPQRFVLALSTALLIPASFYLSTKFLKRHRLRFIFLLWILWLQLIWQIAYPPSILPLMSGVKDEKDSFVDRLRKLPSTGRILIEDKIGSSPTRLLLPFLTKQEFLGMFVPNAPPKYNAATGFQSKTAHTPSMLFGKPLSEYSRDSLKEAFRSYNIAYIVAFSLQARSRLDRYADDYERLRYKNDDLVLSTRKPVFPPKVPPYQIYKVRSYELTDFIRGSGRLNADYNRLEISDPSWGEIILKYHWIKNLKPIEGVKIKKHFVGKDPVPFIKLVNTSEAKRIVVEAAP